MIGALAVQVFIVASGCLGMWLLVRADCARKRRNAYVVLFLAQPFWIGLTWQAGQWGMLVMALFYAWLFLRGGFKAHRETLA